MNTLLKKITAIGLISLLAISTSYAIDMPHKNVDRLVKKLKLDEVQTVKFKEIMAIQETERAAIRAEKKQVAKLFERGDVDAAAEQASSSARAEVYNKAELNEKLSVVLSPEQLKELQDMKKKKMHKKPRNKKANKNKQATEH